MQSAGLADRSDRFATRTVLGANQARAVGALSNWEPTKNFTEQKFSGFIVRATYTDYLPTIPRYVYLEMCSILFCALRPLQICTVMVSTTDQMSTLYLNVYDPSFLIIVA